MSEEDKNIVNKLAEGKLTRRSLLKWSGLLSIPVIAGGGLLGYKSITEG